ncbi:hypothetical protein L1987_78295 [Smallanthus sonchifolius]|uniref:Uncharacterized protein n=1 Tax=Smallanthus sonchifolius TaxID=185202 RepID=A0ACB8ZC96_9ASTR|nr:hypothetical protein L1987_78295 [Smallanthus sonchifolius]
MKQCLLLKQLAHSDFDVDRAKLIHSVINEITEDDVNDLSDQIREQKEELIKAITDARYSLGSNAVYKNGSARQNVNQDEHEHHEQKSYYGDRDTNSLGKVKK